MFAEKSRTKVATQVLIVKRAASLDYASWISWIRIVFGLLPMFLLVSMLLGPLSTACITALLFRYAAALISAATERFGVSRAQMEYWFNVAAAGSIFLFVVVWSYILLSGRYISAVAIA